MVNEAYEYTTDKKSEGLYKLSRFLMICFYVIFMVALFVLAYVSRVIPAYALAPVLLWILILFTWRFVSIEYKYTVEAGVLNLVVVYGSKTERSKASFHIKEAVAFLPLEKAKGAIADFAPQKTFNFLPTAKNPKDAYAFMIVKDKRRILALIEAPTPSKKEILYYATEDVRTQEYQYTHPC